MQKLNVIGYYKESEVVHDEVLNDKLLYMIVYENSTVDGKKTWLEGYNVFEGHFEIDKQYLISCKQITKEEYLQATKGWYTPKEYL